MASIDQLLETLANPEGRFKTLEGIHLKVKTGSRITACTAAARLPFSGCGGTAARMSCDFR